MTKRTEWLVDKPDLNQVQCNSVEEMTAVLMCFQGRELQRIADVLEGICDMLDELVIEKRAK